MEPNSLLVRWSRLWLSLVGLVVIDLLGCGGAGEADEGRVSPSAIPCPTAEPPEGKDDQPLEGAKDVLGFDADGRLSWFDGDTGRVLAKEAPRPGGESVLSRDVAFDRWRWRAVVFESDAEDQSGEISIHTMARGHRHFEDRRHWLWVDGRARVLPVPRAVLVFEEGYGERWRVVRNDGVPTVSVPAPRPASVWLAPSDHGLEVNALAVVPTNSSDQLQWLRAEVSHTQISPPEGVEIGLSVGSHPVARMAPSVLSDGVHVVDMRHGELVLSYHDADGAQGDTWVLGEATGRIEQLMPLGPLADGRERVAILLSQPGTVVVVDLGGGSTADQTSQATWRRLGLDGAIRTHDRFFARDMVAQSSARLLVATDVGVVAIDVVDGQERPTIAVSDSFRGAHLRGPLARVGDPHGW